MHRGSLWLLGMVGHIAFYRQIGLKFFLGLQSVTGYLGLALDFVVRRLGRGLIAIFRDFFASADEIFVLAGGWALAHHLWGLDTFLMFPNLLGS